MILTKLINNNQKHSRQPNELNKIKGFQIKSGIEKEKTLHVDVESRTDLDGADSAIPLGQGSLFQLSVQKYVNLKFPYLRCCNENASTENWFY